MEHLSTHLIVAILTFAMTNVDDLLLLSFYFANPSYRNSHIFIGQYLGVISLVTISLTGMLLGKILEPAWIGLLGLVPVFLGIKDLVQLRKKTKEDSNHPADAKKGIQFIHIALITMANGGDNIGVYTPLFASVPASIISFYILVFLVMISVWCMLARYTVNHPFLKGLFSKYGSIALPFFLILLGIWIMAEADTWSLFVRA